MHQGARTHVGPPPRFLTSAGQLGFGAWGVGGQGWGPSPPGDARERLAAVAHAAERGITFFDTAPSYGDGESERLLGRALAGRRDRVAIATKVGPHDDPRASLEASLRRLATEYVDVVQLHEALERWEWQLERLQRLQDEGKALAIGLCNATHLELARALELAPVASYQGTYNVFDRDAAERALPLCRARGLAFLAARPLASGLLAGKYRAPPAFADGDHRRGLYWFKGREFARRQAVIERLRPIARRVGVPLPALALAWVLHQPGVGVVLAGARNAAQVDENLGATRPPASDVLSEIDAAVAAVFRPVRATAELERQAAGWGARERFIVARLDGRARPEAIAALWTDGGEQPMVAAQVKVFCDQLAELGLVAEDGAPPGVPGP